LSVPLRHGKYYYVYAILVLAYKAIHAPQTLFHRQAINNEEQIPSLGFRYRKPFSRLEMRSLALKGEKDIFPGDEENVIQ
jgi:hypothetical protein